MDKLLDRYKLIQKELFNLNSAVSIKEMEFLVKSPPTNKILVPSMFTGEFHETSTEEIPIIYTLFIKLKREKFPFHSIRPAFS